MSRNRNHQSVGEKTNADDNDFICKVSASKVGFSTKGELGIRRINDTLYMAEFSGPFADSVQIDLDCMDFLPEHRIVNLNTDDGRYQSYTITDPVEYSVLMEAKAECDSICDLKLRLNSLLRDVYFSGLYSTLKTDHKMVIKDEVEKLRIEAPNLFFSTLPDRIDSATDLEKERNAIESAASKAVCAFCFKVRSQERDLGFAIHPYVPKNFQGQPIYMCSTCVENWKEYRDAADHHHQLVLENEVNEEVCAVCSDTPETLVLCSGCPRSFCHTCLLKILSKNDHKALTAAEDSDWQCMCCANNIDALPPMTRDSWVRIRSLNTIEAERLKKKDSTASVPAGAAPAPVAAVVASASTTAVAHTAGASSSAVDDGSRRSNRRHEKLASEAETAAEAEAVAASAAVAAEVTGRRGGRTRHIPAALVEDMEVDIPTGGRGGGGGRSKRKYQEAAPPSADDEEHEVENLPPVSAECDETYYFAQYIKYIDNATYMTLHGSKKEINEALTCTDDSCFLCKDGGELIECDWKHPSKKKCRCLKVYHQYCLEYEVKDGVKWCCPRHFCDVCGSQNLKYICKYCTLSICASCPSELVKRYGYVNYSELEDLTGEFDGSVPIACHNCIELFNRSQARPELLEGLKYPINLKVKKFPGVAGRKKEGVFRVVRGSGGESSSRNVRTSASDVKVETVKDEVVNEATGAPMDVSAAAEEVKETARANPTVEAVDAPVPTEAQKSLKTPRRRAASNVSGSSPPVETSASGSSPPATNAAVEASPVEVNASSTDAAAEGSSSSSSTAAAVSSAALTNNMGSSRQWPDHQIQRLLEGGRIYGTDVDKMLKDPNYSDLLIFRTQAQIKAKILKLFEASGERPEEGGKSIKTVKGGSALKKVMLSGDDTIPFL